MLFGRQSRHVKRILIVEDEPLVAFDNEVMIEGAGYKVVATTDNVSDALAIIARDRSSDAEDAGIDLVLSDITLAGQRSGADLAIECHKLGLPVLFATANPPESNNGTAVGVLMKPYNERRLKAALRAVEQILAGKSKVKQPDGVILYPRPNAV